MGESPQPEKEKSSIEHLRSDPSPHLHCISHLGSATASPVPTPKMGTNPKPHHDRPPARPPAAANTAHSPRADGDLHRHDLPGTCRGLNVALAPLAARRRRALRLRQREPYTSYYCYILAVASSQRMMTTRIVIVAACRSCVAPYGVEPGGRRDDPGSLYRSSSTARTQAFARMEMRRSMEPPLPFLFFCLLFSLSCFSVGFC